MIGANAFGAQNTLVQVTNDKGIGLLKRLVQGHWIEVDVPHSQLRRDIPQPALVTFAADKARLRVFSHHQAYNVAPVQTETLIVRNNPQSMRDRGYARRKQPTTFLVLNKTQAARSVRLESRVVTKGRNLNA